MGAAQMENTKNTGEVVLAPPLGRAELLLLLMAKWGLKQQQRQPQDNSRRPLLPPKRFPSPVSSVSAGLYPD